MEYSEWEHIEFEGKCTITLREGPSVNEYEFRQKIYPMIEEALGKVQHEGGRWFDDEDLDVNECKKRSVTPGVPVSINLYTDGDVKLTDYETENCESGSYDFFCDYMDKDKVQTDFGTEIVATVTEKLKKAFPDSKFEVSWTFDSLNVQSEEQVLDKLHDKVTEEKEKLAEWAAEHFGDPDGDSDLEDRYQNGL